MPSVANLSKIFTRIKEAGAPPKFTHDFLKSSLGFTSSNDRSVITILKKLGLLSNDGTPTDRYHEFRAGLSGNKILTIGLKEGWSDIFLADQKANTKNSSQLTEIFKTVTGKSESVSVKMATTFKTLSDLADWGPSTTEEKQILPKQEQNEKQTTPVIRNEKNFQGLSLNQDIHIHLPPTSDVAVYKAIFR